jgi:flagellar hook-associated protein 3 FlgL
MNYRITDNSSAARFTSRVNAQQNRLNTLQEQLASGKRINRPSDDPNGAEAVITLRTSQKEIEQFQRSAQTTQQKLVAADDTLNGYENLLQRVRTLVTQGLSDTATQTAKNALATEIETLRGRILNVANSNYNGEYLFGGTRQNAPPFDQTTAAPAATPATAQHIQIEPGANAIAVGVTAESFLSDATSDIFTDLTDAVAALRGTGNPTTDRTTLETTMSRLAIYNDLANVAHTNIGANMNAAELAQENLTNNFQTLAERISAVEDIDFAETAINLAETQRNLEAILQATANRPRSLFDLLG